MNNYIKSKYYLLYIILFLIMFIILYLVLNNYLTKDIINPI